MNPLGFQIEVAPIAELLEKLIDEAHAKERRKHEHRMKELEMIANSSVRDDYVQQLLLDKFLAPVEKAQRQLQDAAKHAQWLAEMFNYYYRDHGATQEQGKEVSEQLRVLAIKITEANSLYDLKILYNAATAFTHRMSSFKHRKHKYCLELTVRYKILNVLNDCIAAETTSSDEQLGQLMDNTKLFQSDVNSTLFIPSRKR